VKHTERLHRGLKDGQARGLKDGQARGLKGGQARGLKDGQARELKELSERGCGLSPLDKHLRRHGELRRSQ